MLKMRPFTKYDWYGYAGATSFAPHVPPMMGAMRLWIGGTFVEATVLMDAQGCEVNWWEDDDEEAFHFLASDNPNLVFGLEPDMCQGQIEALGFKEMQ